MVSQTKHNGKLLSENSLLSVVNVVSLFIGPPPYILECTPSIHHVRYISYLLFVLNFILNSIIGAKYQQWMCVYSTPVVPYR